ncbi:helix-turn-helix domain-containing protein [Aureispira anguillae]|uniref:Helix-turn-helix domain-containing protein n=1 Tax=Aureispira anguillae TaxID=2864201 RepID=A0A915YBQ7_9BACT|nr:helix-turn-helix domain-containing protein [Aureispira anguillae]BDS10148.1 helix-turn-helix domain-containing protein [Aureispira anguillae]
MTIQEIGNRLNVALVLEGSVRKFGEKVRIITQLINVEDGCPFWAETYDHELQDIFRVQDQIALTVAEKMREHLGHFEVQQPKNRRNENLSNYELYLKSKYNFNKFQEKNIRLAVQQIEQVIEADATCSYYFATQALYYCYLPLLNIMPAATAFVRAKEAATKALALDKTDPEANYAIASVAYFFEGDLEKAQQHGYAALEYRPNYPDALVGMSMVELAAENYDMVLNGIKKAIEINPLSPTLKYYYAALLQRLGKYEAALKIINNVLALVPFHTNSYCLKGVLLTRLKKFEAAIDHYKNVPLSAHKTKEYYAGIGIVYGTMGDKEMALIYLNKVNKDQQNFNVAYEENANVIINIYLGNWEVAFAEIQKDIVAKKHYLKFFRQMPALELIKEDPRYSILENVFINSGKKYKKNKVKYAKSGINEERINLINGKLIQLMKNKKPFLIPNISLRGLSELLGESGNHVSQVINDKHAMNFFDFINTHRIEEMVRLMKIPTNRNLTLLALAHEAGFNSKTTFNTAFKKLKQQTPTAYFKHLNLL